MRVPEVPDDWVDRLPVPVRYVLWTVGWAVTLAVAAVIAAVQLGEALAQLLGDSE